MSVLYIEILKFVLILNNFKKNLVFVGELIIIGLSLIVIWIMYMFLYIY